MDSWNGFKKWNSTPRLFNSNMTITEKIDGSNGAIHVVPSKMFGDLHSELDSASYGYVTRGRDKYVVLAQSRSRILSVEEDNHGFAQWVIDRAETLVDDLGVGVHYGEFWGLKINSGYNTPHKHFSLFNADRWEYTDFTTEHLHHVPILYRGKFDTSFVKSTLLMLQSHGSFASPGFRKPEGVCVFHHASKQTFKYTLNGDGHKGQYNEKSN